MSGVYIHIPFCRQSCIYCNFYFKTGKKRAEDLCDALLKEMQMKLEMKPFELETLYFGGGTPSYLDPLFISSLILKTKALLGTEHLKEITIEANPDDMNFDHLQAWKQMGISRLSVGVQSFFDPHLRWMNRAHSAAEALSCLEMASEMGFELSLDLIFGVPGCTDEQWLSNLEKACAFNISHLSCYGLTLEENTPWKRLIKKGVYQGPDENQSSRQFKLTMDYLRSRGWVHYEISNYCKPGKMAVHNTSYWQNKPYVGLGPSAHSFDGNKRSWNISDINAYINSINEGLIPEESELLSDVNKHNEYLMTGLRTMWGIEMNQLIGFGFNRSEQLKKMDIYFEKGWLIRQGDTILLSDEGKMFADVIASDLFV